MKKIALMLCNMYVLFVSGCSEDDVAAISACVAKLEAAKHDYQLAYFKYDDEIKSLKEKNNQLLEENRNLQLRLYKVKKMYERVE